MIAAMEKAPAAKLPFLRPAMLAATLCGVGLLPRAPGTFGALVAVPFAWVLARGGAGALLVAAAALFLAGWWAAAIVVRARGEDPPAIVIDEAAGQVLTLAAAPLDPWFYAAGFALFRLFDIWKPYPIRGLERHVKGGLGVMIDDLVAGFYAYVVFALFIIVVYKGFGYSG